MTEEERAFQEAETAKYRTWLATAPREELVAEIDSQSGIIDKLNEDVQRLIAEGLAQAQLLERARLTVTEAADTIERLRAHTPEELLQLQGFPVATIRPSEIPFDPATMKNEGGRVYLMTPSTTDRPACLHQYNDGHADCWKCGHIGRGGIVS